MKSITVFLLGLVISHSLFGQAGVDSPYSRFGIGQLTLKSANPRVAAMGGLANAIGSNAFLNYANPASYTQIDSLSFLFNTGLSMGSTNLQTTVQSETASGARLAYITAGFPVTTWWRTSVGLLPYSNVGYDIFIPFEDELTGSYAKVFSGTGGLNRMYIGNAFAITEQLSIGVNASYLFGQQNNSVMVYFPDSTHYINTKTENSTRLNSFIFDYGLLYNMPLGNERSLSIGLTFGQQMRLDVKRNYIEKAVEGGLGGNIENVQDTIFYSPEEEGSLILPAQIGVGLVYTKHNNWLAGVDFNWQNWEAYEAFGLNDSLVNSWNIAVGGAFTPPHTSISKYWRRVTYRAGFRYEQTYLSLRGTPLNEFGISFGVGLPLPRSLSTVDLSLELGRRGTTTNDLVQETFINFTLGVAIYERWFMQRRYR